MKIFPFATAALFASVLAVSATLTVTPEQPALKSAVGSTETILVTATDAWAISESADWLSLSTTAGVAGTTTVTLTALSDNTTASRSAEVTLRIGTAAAPTETRVFVVVQSATTTTTTTTTADTAAPTLTITAGSTKSVYQKAVISGTATDTGATGAVTGTSSGVQQVYWREEGSSKWRKAMMGGRGTASATWFVNVTLKKKAGRRLFFKAVDGAGNEGVITDRFKWDTTGTVTTTPTPTTTVTTGG